MVLEQGFARLELAVLTFHVDGERDEHVVEGGDARAERFQLGGDVRDLGLDLGEQPGHPVVFGADRGQLGLGILEALVEGGRLRLEVGELSTLRGERLLQLALVVLRVGQRVGAEGVIGRGRAERDRAEYDQDEQEDGQTWPTTHEAV